MTLPSGRALLVLVLLAVGLLAGPAAAHESDPRLVTVLDEVVPALPDEVVLQVQAGLAMQLVASNPTPTVLEVLGSGDRPFLRLSSADVASRDFSATSRAGRPSWRSSRCRCGTASVP